MDAGHAEYIAILLIMRTIQHCQHFGKIYRDSENVPEDIVSESSVFVQTDRELMSSSRDATLSIRSLSGV